MNKVMFIACALVLATAAGCSCYSSTPKTTTTSPGMVNSTCPMSGKVLKEGCPTSMYKGDTVGFCGTGCKAAFDGKTDAEKSADVASMKNGS